MVTPRFHLLFKGDCPPAMTHCARALSETIEGVFLNRDAATPDLRMSGGDDPVMDLSMRLVDTPMMASETSDEMYERPRGFCIQIEAPSASEFGRVDAALSEGARDITMPPGETFWAERFAMFTDRFGTPWMLNFTGSGP